MSYLETTKKKEKIVFDAEKIARAIVIAYEATHQDDQYTEEELMIYHSYIHLLAEIEWPAYINGDSEFHQIILDAFENKGVAGVEEEMYKYYNPIYLKTLEEQLSDSNVIKRERIPLFHEAFLLYQLGYYYGAVAILITQIVGITSDIEKFMKKYSVPNNPDNLRLMKTRYKMFSENDTSRVMKVVLEGKSLNEVQGEYNYLLGYLRSKIFRTNIPKTQQKEQLLRHPNRNLLCHGVQINYGTREHALKIILCIDALSWVAEVISDNLNTLLKKYNNSL